MNLSTEVIEQVVPQNRYSKYTVPKFTLECKQLRFRMHDSVYSR